MLTISSRLPDIGTTIFDVMTKMANEHGAINLSQGFPDFDIDPKLIDLVHQSMVKGQNQYATMPGVAALREVLAKIPPSVTDTKKRITEALKGLAVSH